MKIYLKIFSFVVMVGISALLNAQKVTSLELKNKNFKEFILSNNKIKLSVVIKDSILLGESEINF